jgi:hypothetical protein
MLVMMRKLFPLVLIFISLASCKKPVSNHEYPFFEATPTFNAFLVEGDSVKVSLSMAQSPDSASSQVCKDAEMLLFVDDVLVGHLVFDSESEFYCSDLIAESGKKYSFKAVMAGYDTLSASVEIPLKPEITDVDLLELAGINEDGEAYPSLLVSFKTDPRQELYYRIIVKAVFRIFGEVHVNTIISSDYVDDPVLLHEGMDILVFSNEIIDDTVYTIKINEAYNKTFFSDKLVVCLQSISKDYYQYLKSYALYQQSIEATEDISLGVVQPFNLFGNVENGLGVLGGCAAMEYDTVYFGGGER